MKFLWNPVEISMEYQWKYVGNPAEILNTNENIFEIKLKFKLKSNGNPIEIE